MRNAERLDQFYEELKQFHKRYLPDWRFGQLMYNFQNWVMKNIGRDIFYIEDVTKRLAIELQHHINHIFTVISDSLRNTR